MKTTLLASIAVLGLGLAGPGQAASFLLDFTGSGGVPDTYGDNAWADLSYRSIAFGTVGNQPTQGGTSFWSGGYGDLDGAIWGNGNPSVGEIRIQALNPGETVTIDSFDMGGWAADESASWYIFDLSWSLLTSGSGIAPNTGGRLSVAPGTSAVGGLIFQWGDDAWDVGVENFAYSVSGDAAVVPLPAGGALLLAALGALALRTRRR